MHALLPDHACLQAPAGRWGTPFHLGSIFPHEATATAGTGRNLCGLIPIEGRSPRPVLKPLSDPAALGLRPWLEPRWV